MRHAVVVALFNGLKMTNHQLELLAQYAALRLGCERALALLQDPDASDFDAWKVMDYLKIVLKVQK
jgi:hypothetical protein